MLVGLWGFYSQGNFGDDLMAWLFSNALKAAGQDVLIYSGSKTLAKQCEQEICPSIDALTQKVDLLLLGGGCYFEKANWRDLINPGLRKIEKEFRDLALYTKAAKLPLWATSIGGDGTTNPSILKRNRQAIIDLLVDTNVTVRTRPDVELLKKCNKSVPFFHDCLFSIGDHIPTQKIARASEPNKPIRIGINVSARRGKPVYEAAIEIKKRYGDRVELFYIGSHSERSYNYELLPEDGKGSIFHHDQLVPTTQFLSSLDIIVSTKLHVGVVALSYGTVFLSYKGRGKTRECLQAAGLKDYIVGSEIGARLEREVQNCMEAKAFSLSPEVYNSSRASIAQLKGWFLK